MKIIDSALTLSGRHQLEIKYSKTERLRFWKSSPSMGDSSSLEAEREDWLELSEEAKEKWVKYQTQTAREEGKDGEGQYQLSPQQKNKIHLIEKLLSALTGRPVKLNVIGELNIKADSPQSLTLEIKAGLPQKQPVNEGFGLDYQLQETYRETETTAFEAQGFIRTADGREITFETRLNMNREFITSNQISIKAGEALKDPLVINYDGVAAELTNEKITFDLDADHNTDSISFVRPGSGFLALDRNHNNQIDDGTELFGPTSGNGFSELAGWDEDQNGWIDEADPVFKDLRIWTYDNKYQLLTLDEARIGAIATQNIGTEFCYANAANQLQGALRSTGVFLREDGSGGTVQQIDLVV